MAIKRIASILQAARARAGLTQRQLAARAGTAQSFVARIELGLGNPTVSTIEQLLDATGFELELVLVPKAAQDPLIDAFKRDIDRTLLRDNLRKGAAERVAALEAMARFHDEAARARSTRSR